MGSPEGLQRVLSANDILRSHESVTRSLEFQMGGRQSTLNLQKNPKFSSLMEVLRKREDRRSYFVFLHEQYLEAR